MFRRCGLAAIVLVAPIALCPAAPQRADKTLADVLPAETFFYASVDMNAVEAGIKSLDLAAMLRDAEVNAFLKPLFDQMLPGVDSKDPVASLLKQSPTGAWVKGEVSIGIAGIEVAVGAPDATPMRVSPEHPMTARFFHQLISIPDGDGEGQHAESPLADTWLSVDGLLSIEPGEQLRDIVKEFLAAPPKECEVAEAQIAGRDVTVLSVRSPDGFNMRAWCDLSGPRWLIGGSKKSFEAALGGGRQGSLSASEVFQRCKKRVTAGATAAFVMLDTKKADAMLVNFAPPILLEELEMLGLDTIRGIALGVSFVEGGVRESMLLAFDGEPRGLLAPLKAFGGGFATMTQAPANTAFFAGLRFDPAKLVAEIHREAARLLPNSSAVIDKELAKVEIGSLNLVKDVIPAFGSEISLALGVPKTGIYPDAVFVLELRDVERFEKLLEFAKSAAAGDGVEIRPLPLADGREGFSLAIPDAPVQPAFVIDGNRLVGAISGQALKGYLAKTTRGDKSTLADDAGLASLRRAFAGCAPEAGAFWMHVDLQKSMPMAYALATPFFPVVIEETQLPLDSAQVPLAETLAQYLKSIAIAFHCDAGGLSIDAFSPTGLLLLGVAVGAAESHHSASAVRYEEIPPPVPDDGMDDDDDDDDGGGDN